MATKLSKATADKIEVVRRTAEAMRDTEGWATAEGCYWNGYLRATEQVLRILRGEE